MSRKIWVAVLGCGLALAGGLQGLAQQAKTDAEVADEAKKAYEILHAQNFVTALPMYEELHALRPKANEFTEGLAMCLLGNTAHVNSAQEKYALTKRARDLLLEAQKNGDNSDYLQTILEKTEGLAPPSGKEQQTPATEALAKAEKLFTTGDMAGALQYYKEATRLDPHMYEAPLFAGDAEYKQNHFKEAGEWYAKAIAIDPNRETAYRYWGDAETKAGNLQAARDHYIEAVIAQPYSNTTWSELKNWATRTKTPIYSPQIKLPAGPVQDPKKPNTTNITIDASALGQGGSATWLMYPMTRALWQGEKFKKTFPNEKQYRHSLAEEMDALGTVIAVAKEQKGTPDSNVAQLVALDKDKMLECWLLLNNADQGIAQDYVAYREKHRELLHAYIAKYVLHPGK